MNAVYSTIQYLNMGEDLLKTFPIQISLNMKDSFLQQDSAKGISLVTPNELEQQQ